MQLKNNYHKNQKICSKNLIITKSSLITKNFTGGNKVDYDFTNFSLLIELFKTTYHGKILISGAEREQDEFNDKFKKLERYRPRTSHFKNDKKSFNERTKFL